MPKLSRRVEDLHAGDGLHGLVVEEGPHHLLFGRDFDQVGGFPKLAMAEPIGHDGVAVGQALHAGHEFEADAGQFVPLHLPDRFAVGIDFKDAGAAFAIATGN